MDDEVGENSFLQIVDVGKDANRVTKSSES